jgi:hypothetical protein
MQEAHSNPDQRASRNGGKPPVAATARPGELRGNGVVKASDAGGHYAPPARENGQASTAGHVRELPPAEHLTAPSSGNAKQDKQNQKQFDKQYAQQQKERQQLQKQQDKEDQKIAKQNDSARKQQVEQQHQQQTQQLQQKHQQQNQQLQQSVQARPQGGGRPR